MSENNSTKPKKSFSADWLVGGSLTKIGQTFDRLLGRNWKPTSSLATSELIERLKKLLDSEVKDLGEKGQFVPHNIKLKMQWNKFSTDSETVVKKLEYEMLAAAIDHINDNRYHTYKPLKIEIKPDYFTEGIKFLASFGEFDEEEKEAVINITVPQMKVGNLIPETVKIEPESESYIAEFTANSKSRSVELKFLPGKRVGVGRTKENDLSIEDPSISKVHAALVLNSDNQLMVADTGSTNGTFINGQRIAYGRAFPVGESDKLKFGTVEVFMRLVPKQTDFETSQSYTTEMAATQNFETKNETEIHQNQVTRQNIQASQNQPTIQDFETNRDFETQKKAAENQPVNNYQPVQTPQTITSVETNSSIPVPQPIETQSSIPLSQPKDTFQAKQDADLNIIPETEKQKPETKEIIADKENQSQVFNTEPRVNFNFDDEQK